jgi:apolipoprotein D and lipocalin family protein
VSYFENMDLSQETLQADFDIDRYTGEWFEIAKLPNFFEVGCSSAKANYQRIATNAISVLNTCLDEEGGGLQRPNPAVPGTCLNAWIFGTGIARDLNFPAALNVSFPSSPEADTPIPNYLVHKTDYDTFAVVGSPDRRGLFLLARDQIMSKKLYRKLLRFVEKLGYNTNNIIINTQDGRPVVRH